ncbi:MAG: lipoyl(octanoyl) transferase LipB [Candidatus Omnitrophota bacterium]
MEFEVFDIGLFDFRRAWQFQREVFKAVKNGGLKSALVVCRHYPVITLGREASLSHILAPQKELKERKIAIYKIERGGGVTYHGPGQLTMYPVFNLDYLKKDIHWFLRKLEEIAMLCLSDFGISSQRRPGLTGVWLGEQKIASIGIAIKSWITFHGLSINVKKDDLANFRLIRPCGMDIEMTALEAVLGRAVEIDSLKNQLIQIFRKTFLNSIVKVPPERQRGGNSHD